MARSRSICQEPTQMADGDAIDTAELYVKLRGAFLISHRGRTVEFPTGRVRRLLAYLLIHPHGVQRSRLAGLFWPESTDEQARTNLRRELHTLKKHLPCADTILKVDKTTLSLAPTASIEIDLSGDEELLPGVDEPWIAEIRRQFEAERVRELEASIGEAEAKKDYRNALDGLTRLLNLDPLREDLHRHIMRLHLANGDRGSALQAYQGCLSILDEELGVSPSPATRALHEKLISWDEEPSQISQELPDLEPMVGRTQEWALTLTWLEVAQVERASPLLFVLGEPGIGKSRLLAELAREVQRRGGRLITGRCYEAEQHRPFVPWEEAVTGFQELLISGAQDGNRAVQFNHLIKHICRDSTGPIVVLIDDLQWVDEASAALIHFAYRSGKMLVCCAARIAEWQDNPHAQRLVRSLTRERMVRRLELGPLGEEAIRVLAPGAEPVRCGGNPLLAMELARVEEDGGQSLQELLESRMSALSSQSRELVSWAAALGSDFSAVKLRQVCGRPLLELLGALEELEKHSLLRPRGERYDFVHDIVREAAYSSMSGPRRQLLHLQIAQALEGSAHPGEVAHHSVLAGESVLAARACKDGCFEYLRVLAFHEAHQLAELGLEQASSVRNEWKLKVELFRGLLLSGIPDDKEPQWRAGLNELIEELSKIDEDGLRARATTLLTMWEFDRQDLDKVQERSSEAAELARLVQPKQAAHMLAHSAACFATIRRDIPKAKVLLGEATQLADRYGSEVLEIHLAQGLLARFDGHDEEAERCLVHTLKIAGRKDIWRSVVALTHLAMLRLDGGRYDEVPQLCRELEELGSRLGPGSEAAIGMCLTALANGSRSEWEEAQTELRKVDNKRMLAYCLRKAAGRFQDKELLEQACRAARGIDQSELVLAQVALASEQMKAGDFDDVRTVLKSQREWDEHELTAEAREARNGLRRAWTKNR